ncbi:MAG TPA: hypothetical protein PLB79_05435 [Thermotogota bacterium]|jgi:hypothetical protein|nr:hypothetical protein [Thermotogota bacterium]OQC29409.1 MAG: hypothetical protein BWX67_02187 [Thermotogota bacterium ADurb.Bin062]HNW45887.1 hypothetical protein [Thermotogota bacterium]HNY81545.1 hypothetical protein [Thermotogota bacterium]HOD90316.1 hypothetical protein [Thermotogota bacterium]
MKRRSVSFLVISILLGCIVFGANMPVMAGQMRARAQGVAENAEYLAQLTLAKVINELELTNEQLSKILAAAKDARTKLGGLKEAAEKQRQELLDLLVARNLEGVKAFMSERKAPENPAVLLTQYVNTVKDIFTYAQGDKLSRLFNGFGGGFGPGNRSVNPPSQTRGQNQNKRVPVPRQDQLRQGAKQQLRSFVAQPRMSAQCPQALNQLSKVFLTDWGIDLLERFIAVK